MNKLYRSLLLTSIAAAGLAGCGDDVTVVDPPPPPPPPAPTINQVTVGPDGVAVSPGQNIQMTAAVTSSAGCNPAVTWGVSDAARASVSGTGLVTIAAAAASGPVAVRATAVCATGGATGNGVATLNVVGTTVTGVTVTPSQAQINAGTANTAPQTLQASATVQGTNNPSQAVTWTSLDQTIATVSVSGLVTANANGLGGPVNIRACSNADNTKCGFLALTVLVPSPTSVQIQSVTFNNGTNNVPVSLVNVFGQIEIGLNVEPGARTVTRVDALIGGQVVASQSFSSAAPPADADAPEAAPTLVILSTNTAQLRESGGTFVPVIFNGNSAITANLFVQGSQTPIASNAIPVVMNNPDAVARRRVGTRTATLKETVSTPSAVAGGNTWFKGTQSISGYDYLAFGKAVPASVILDSDVCGDSNNLVPGTASATGGIALAGTYGCGGVEGGNDVEEFVDTDYAAGAIGPDGTPLVEPENSSCGQSFGGVSTVGSAFLVNNENRWNMFCPPVAAPPGTAFIDNKGPTVQVAGSGGGSVKAQVAFNASFDQQWIGAAYVFGTSGGVPFVARDLFASDGGVGLAAGFPAARLITGSGTLTVPYVCGATVAGGTGLAETVTSIAIDGYRITSYAEDLLANPSSCGGLAAVNTVSNYFGVDNVAPTIRFLGAASGAGVTPLPASAGGASLVSVNANTTIYNIAAARPSVLAAPVPGFGVEALDTRSGFHQIGVIAGLPATQSLARNSPAGAANCTMASSALGTILTDTWVRVTFEVPEDCAPTLGVGYYNYSGNVTDRAGNKATAVLRNYLADDLFGPNITGLGFASALYTPGGAGSFGISANDDVEIIDGTLLMTQTNPVAAAGIRYPFGTLTAIGTRWDATFSNILNGANLTNPNFLFRVDGVCTGAAAPYASCPATAGVVNTVSAEYTAPAAALPTFAAAGANDAGGNPSGTISAPMLATQFNPSAGIAEPWVAADLIQWNGFSSALPPPSTGSSARGVHMASTSIVVPFFDSAELWRLSTAGELVRCGLVFAAPTLTDNGFNRFWTYAGINLPTVGPCTGAAFPAVAPLGWVAVGFKGGAALVSNIF